MNTSTLNTALLSLVLTSASTLSMAADPRLMPVGQTGPQRGLFGLPIPQQLTSVRPTGSSWTTQMPGDLQNGYASGCPNGQCQPGTFPSGQFSTGNRSGGRSPNGQRSTAACPNGQCLNAACANGQCPLGCCVNGTCLTGACTSDARGSAACPKGNCRLSPNLNLQAQSGVQSGWMPRSVRSVPSDSFQRSGEFSENDGRTQRPAIAPLPDVWSPDYRPEELNLRSGYFGYEDDARDDHRSVRPGYSHSSSDGWSMPARRSLEAPVESTSGVARF